MNCVLRALAVVFALVSLAGCCWSIDLSAEQITQAIAESKREQLVEGFDGADEDLHSAIERAENWLESDAAIAKFESLGESESRTDVLEWNRRLLKHMAAAPSAERCVQTLLYSGLATFPFRVTATGYYAPEYEASRVRTDAFSIPLYEQPDDMRDNTNAAWRTRSEIENEQLLAGRELVWLADPLDAFLVHVNGSARLRMTDGSVMHIGHSGTNNLEYTSIGRLMIDDGRATAEEMSMQTIRRVYEDDPEYVLGLIAQNDRYVFFEEIADVGGWPRGGMGMVITPLRSAAVDPKYYPPGSVLLMVTELATPDGGFEPFVQLMVAQDVGGAIKGPGRIDLFIGVGDEAGEIAGRQVSEGVVYPLILVPMNDE